MTAGNRDNQTNLVDARSGLGIIVALVLVPGCTFVPNLSPDVQPDMKAIVAVVEDAYGQLGQAASVFLAADAVEDTTMARVRSTLSDDLASAFRPPSARIYGDPGASSALGRFNLVEDGPLSVAASYVQEDGTGPAVDSVSCTADGGLGKLTVFPGDPGAENELGWNIRFGSGGLC